MPKLNEENAAALKDLVQKAMKDLRTPITANQDLIADIYTGRDPGGTEVVLPEGGVQWDMLPDSANNHNAPDTTANLFLSRLRQIVVSTTPGRPNFEISPLVPGAVYQVETQQILTDVIMRQTNIAEIFERAAFLGPTQNYFGIKLVPNPNAPHILDRLKFEAVEASQCGYEPHSRRFTWHTYHKQWGELPKSQRPTITHGQPSPNDWDLVSVTEVYHEGLALGSKEYAYPMSTFVNPTGKMWERRRKTPHLGDYVGTVDLPAPVLTIDRYLDPAPNEDIPPAEVASWIPLMRQIVQVLVLIVREVNSTNSEILYDADAISAATIDHIRRVQGGKKVYIPVNVNDAQRGVNSTMRPVERNTPLGDYLNTLQMLLSLFDDVTGVGPLDRGAPANPEKSATEAAQLSAAADRRNQDRMRVLARMWGKTAHLIFRWQQELYGDSMEIPTASGITRNYPIPNPDTARFTFQVNVAELSNKSRSQQMNTLMTAHTLLVNDATNLQDPNALRMVGESRRRLLKALGWVDVDLYDAAIFGETGPQERYINMLESGNTIPVYRDDKHEAYLGAYMKLMERAVATTNSDVPVAILRMAIEEHMIHLQEQQAMMAQQAATQPATVPGVGPTGQVDNQVAAQMGAGGAPQQTPQTVQ